MQLLSGQLTPCLQADLARLGARMPFAEAAKDLQHFRGVAVSAAHARRSTQSAGAAYVAVQNAEVERLERTQPPAPAGPPIQLTSVDGAMVPLIHREWAEVKTLAIGHVAEPVLEKGEPVVHSNALSYFSRLTDAEQFGRLALVETHRRGTETAGTVCAVTDGAEWAQRFIDHHREDAVRILDFPHAAGYLAQAAHARWGETSASGQEWLKQNLHELKHGSAETVLQALRDLCAASRTEADGEQTALPILESSLAYLEKRQPMMAYAAFQAAGYPIGSGSVESANKLVVEARLKGAGMHWARPHVDSMVALRCALCSDRWTEAWTQISQQLRQQAKQQQAERCLRRRRASASAAATRVTTPLSPSPAVDVQPVEPSRPILAPVAASTPKPPQRPAADHPWRRFTYGRSRFQPVRSSSHNAKL